MAVCLLPDRRPTSRDPEQIGAHGGDGRRAHGAGDGLGDLELDVAAVRGGLEHVAPGLSRDLAEQLRSEDELGRRGQVAHVGRPEDLVSDLLEGGGLRDELGDGLVLGWLHVAHGEGDEDGRAVADMATREVLRGGEGGGVDRELQHLCRRERAEAAVNRGFSLRLYTVVGGVGPFDLDK
eukprot:4201621-Pyramimonas_sp.AAC.1